MRRRRDRTDRERERWRRRKVRPARRGWGGDAGGAVMDIIRRSGWDVVVVGQSGYTVRYPLSQ